MSASAIRIMLDVLGIQNAKDAAATLYTLKQAIQGVQQLTSYGQGILPPMIGPNQGMARGVADYERQNRELTDQAKQIRDMSVSYREHEQSVFNAGRAYGYMRDQMIQVADAYKQVQGEQNRMGLQTGTLGYGRLTGLDPTFLAGQGQQLAQQGVVTNGGQQNQFFAMMEEAVMRGSRGGYSVLASDLMPLLTNLNAQALNRNPYGYGMSGVQATTDFLANSYASGIPGLRGQGAAQLYSQVNQTLTSSEDGMGGMLAWNAYQAAHPGSSYYDFEYGRQAGMQDPAYSKALVQQIRGVYGSDDKQRFVLGGQALGMTPQNYESFERVMSMSTNPQDYQAELKRIGARGDIDTGAVGLIGRLQGTQDQAGVDQVIKDYENLSNKTYSGKRDKESVERFLGQVAPGSLMGNFADSNEKAKSEIAANYSDAAASIRDYIKSMNEFNQAISGATKTLARLDPQHFAAAGAAASIGGPIIGGVLGGVSPAVSRGAILARCGGGRGGAGAAGGAASAAGSAGAGAAGTGMSAATMAYLQRLAGGGAASAAAGGGSSVVGGAGTSMIFGSGAGAAGGGTAGAASIGMAAALGIPLAFMGAGAALGGVGDRVSGGGQGRWGWAQPLLSLAGGVGSGLGMGAGRRAFEQGPIGNTGLGAFARGVDDWETSHIPGWEAIFGRRAGYEAPKKPGETPAKPGEQQGGTYGGWADDMLASERSQVDLLTKIEAHLAAGMSTDRRAQSAYGATATRTATTSNGITIPNVGGAGGGTSTGGTYSAGGGYTGGGGTPGEGFGDPSVDQVNALLKGTKLEGYGAQIIADAKAAGVPVSVALGMIRQESSFNTPAAGTRNNFGGLKGKGGSGDFADFPDIASGLSAVIGNMGSGVYQGKSLQDFVNTYLGGPAGGDPDAYLKNVMQLIQQLGGNAGPGNVVVGPPGGKGAGGPGQAGQQAASNALALFSRAATPATASAAFGGGGGGNQVVTMEGRVEVVVKQPDGSQESHWVTMSPSTSQPNGGGMINWPTRGNNLG